MLIAAVFFPSSESLLCFSVFLAESMPFQHTDIEDEDVEEEFKKLEMELGDEIPHEQIAETSVDGSSKEVKIQESVAELNETLSNLKLEAA